MVADMPTAISEIGSKYDIRIVNVFHAGDGNIHPILLFDEREPDQADRRPGEVASQDHRDEPDRFVPEYRRPEAGLREPGLLGRSGRLP